MVKAMLARSMSATVKRARVAFTMIPLLQKDDALSSRQPGCLGETLGFASPPRDGFALDGP